MKVTKNNRKPDTAKPQTSASDNSGKYDECIQFIRSAIDCLGVNAKNDDKAKEAIANLSVILFDLQ